MTYREKAIKMARIVGRELADRAEELIPDTEGVKGIDIWIRIPSQSDDPLNVPEIQVSTTVYPNPIAIEKILNGLVRTKGGE